jgi:glycosyltransferase involved in cell wall biosynthesis
MQQNITILIPVFNDGSSLNRLLAELTVTLKDLGSYTISILVVNDGSSEALSVTDPAFPLQVLHLNRNIGHQKAIAVGLAYIREHIITDKVLVMDSDGEDRPGDVATLIRASEQQPGSIIFAGRKSRQEGLFFRFFYRLYKIAFHLLTGKRITFGNFMIMPAKQLEKLVFYSEIWSHIAGGILKSGLSYESVTTHRGKRYEGRSKMSFTALFLHGLGAIAVFIEVIAARLLLFSLLLIGISLMAILALLAIRAFTDLAIPGWTSTVVSAMLIVLLQSFLLSLFTIFLYLSAQSQRKFIPAKHYGDYTGNLEKIR